MMLSNGFPPFPHDFHQMTNNPVECKECAATVEEDRGRWLILDQNEDSGFDWMFLCIQCVRDWRQRGLEREGHSSKEIAVQLDREYPIGKAI